MLNRLCLDFTEVDPVLSQRAFIQRRMKCIPVTVHSLSCLHSFQTFCSGCYTLRKKLQQRATNDKDKCSGCRRVVAISKYIEKNKCLTVVAISISR